MLLAVVLVLVLVVQVLGKAALAPQLMAWPVVQLAAIPRSACSAVNRRSMRKLPVT